MVLFTNKNAAHQKQAFEFGCADGQAAQDHAGAAIFMRSTPGCGEAEAIASQVKQRRLRMALRPPVEQEMTHFN